MPALPPVTEKFILHWGEMGTRWGINRTVAQIHALLYLSPKPLHAEEIAETLSVARSNVSTSLRELQNWGLVRVVSVLGDRRDHFETMKDVWEMFRIVIEERKKREVDPTIQVLRECVRQAKSGPGAGPEMKEQARALAHMLEFFQTVEDLHESIGGMPTSSLVRLAKMGSKFKKLLGRGD